MPIPTRQRYLPIFLIFAALAWCTLGSWMASAAPHSSDEPSPSVSLLYLPFAAKPVPTPTPIPPPPDVRIDWSCCRVKGPTQNPTDEYICFRSHDARPIDMTGWRVLDEAKHLYTFPPFVLLPQAVVTLHSGSGRNTLTDLYWGSGVAIWNNTHDTIYLYDASDHLIDIWTY